MQARRKLFIIKYAYRLALEMIGMQKREDGQKEREREAGKGIERERERERGREGRKRETERERNRERHLTNKTFYNLHNARIQLNCTCTTSIICHSLSCCTQCLEYGITHRQ